MDAKKASKTLIKSIRSPKKTMTVADASTSSGLSFVQTERALIFLVAEFRGELTPTENGELLFKFPTGFKKPWEKKEALDLFWAKTKKTSLGIAKFIVRAWITVVMLGYVAIFAAILIGLSMAKQNDRDDRGGNSFGSMMMLHVLFRIVLDSLFWTFHPFSPLRARSFHNQHRQGYGRQNFQSTEEKSIAFYEKVNKFFFGPEEAEKDPLEAKKLVLAEIRAQRGRIAMLDVLKATGLTKEKADPLLAQLMLEYNGNIKVSDFGGITYSFPELRVTADTGASHSSVLRPSWLKRKVLVPLTGNTQGSNFLIAGLNGFNLLMSTVAIQNAWSINNLKLMFSGFPPEALNMADSAIVMGWIPFWFSLVLFSLPIMRWSMRPKKQQALNKDNGRRGMLWAVLNKLSPSGIQESTLENAWESAAGVKASNRELTREAIKLGADLELNEHSGQTYYRFHSLEAEISALEKERARANYSEQEAGAEIHF